MELGPWSWAGEGAIPSAFIYINNRQCCGPWAAYERQWLTGHKHHRLRTVRATRIPTQTHHHRVPAAAPSPNTRGAANLSYGHAQFPLEPPTHAHDDTPRTRHTTRHTTQNSSHPQTPTKNKCTKFMPGHKVHSDFCPHASRQFTQSGSNTPGTRMPSSPRRRSRG